MELLSEWLGRQPVHRCNFSANFGTRGTDVDARDCAAVNQFHSI
jgi:hypothetical protein